MSQWNNAFTFNDQYQDPNMWNGELNGQQYSNQNPNYYPTRQQYEQQPQGSQYVSFNEFISQIQANGTAQPNNTDYNNAQYSNYSTNQFNNYNNMPSTSQSTPSLDSYQYDGNATANVANGIDSYQPETRSHSKAEATPDASNYTGDVAFKSNLTATATEFIPKATNFKQPANPKPRQTDQTESSTSSNGDNPRKNNSTHERNWRERPSSNSLSNEKQNGPSHKNDDASPRTQESKHRNREQSPRNQDSNYRNQEPRSRNKDRNHESSPRNQDTNHRNNESGSKHQQDRSNEGSSRYQQDRNNEGGSRYQQDRNNEGSSRYQQDRSNEGSSRYQQDRNNEGSSRYQKDRNNESSSRYQEPRENSKNQSKSNSKARNKQPDDGRTFYNSSASKSSQDVRIGRGEGSSGRQEGRKNWVGSQRVRPTERNYVDDEQFANNYHQYREERLERISRVQDARSSPQKSNKNKHFANNNNHGANTEMTQRERLSEQLDKGTLECLVCCERVKQTDTVWSCTNCYHVLHLRCIRKWAMSSMLEGKWRCPACQNQSDMIPTDYRCMCGSTRNPEWQRGATGAHTCGRACARARLCSHPCTLLCHPGPCPPCQATVHKQCGCGAETRSVTCSSKLPQTCAGTCHRKLNCDVHECGQPCHEGLCADCAEIITQLCYCPAGASRTEPCTAATARTPAWSCGDTCGRVLACGAHVCRAPCHPPPCAPCPAEPSTIGTCPCGKMQLEKGKRKVCTDPIPLCGNICAKPLSCGPAGDKHFCKSECHEGACPGCPDKTLLQCRCGHSSREVLCSELSEMLDNVFCQKKCNKKLSCGRHRCRTLCCASETHRCPATCGRSLPCQLHRCEELCHTGHCPPCPIVSFEELPCACGAQRVMPPVRCGTRPPPCTAPCRRHRPCRHPPHHSCHAGDCPPCVVLTTKRCHGDHEERKTIPCSQEEFSCGLPCGKPLPCGKHTCIKVCHKGPCDTAKCTQPCMEKRSTCGHPCGAPCHCGGDKTCPSGAPCRRPVRAVCPCGRRATERACHDNLQTHNKMLNALAASKVQEGGSVDLSELTRPGAMLKTLECDDECRVEQRTRQMALALQIRNPDVSAKLAPRYSDHVRQWAQRDAAFARHVHDKLTELVQLAKKSKQKTRSHSFPSMNWQKRQFIHELCEHFGCESVAYDAEPNRNVVATADKEKSWLPAMSVLEVLAREAGKRRVPGPVLRPATAAAAAASSPATSASSTAKSGSGWATLTSSNAWAARSQPKPAASTAPKIDYFDNPPE